MHQCSGQWMTDSLQYLKPSHFYNHNSWEKWTYIVSYYRKKVFSDEIACSFSVFNTIKMVLPPQVIMGGFKKNSFCFWPHNAVLLTLGWILHSNCQMQPYSDIAMIFMGSHDLRFYRLLMFHEFSWSIEKLSKQYWNRVPDVSWVSVLHILD